VVTRMLSPWFRAKARPKGPSGKRALQRKADQKADKTGLSPVEATDCLSSL
jgi:hypothetical protein